MKVKLTWYRLRWPREVAPDQMGQLFRLLASGGGEPIVIEAVGSAGHVEHRLGLRDGHAEGVIDQLRAALPGLALEEVPNRPPLSISHAVELRLTTKRRPLRHEDMVNISRTVLTALAHVHKHECLVIQWILARSLPALAVPNRLDTLGRESWVGALLLAPLGPPLPPDNEVRKALREKQANPGWRAVGRIGVKTATTSRERQLVRQLIGALCSAEAPGIRFWVRVVNPKRVLNAQAGWRLPLKLNIMELAALSSFPVGSTTELPISKIGSRLVAPHSAIRRKGRVVGRASFPGREREVAITPTDSLRHVHLIGPTGVGKSTLLHNLITQDIEAGRAVVVIEPKSDLIEATLENIPVEHINRVVVLDPADDCPVGLNPLSLNGRSPELVADQLLSLFHNLYASSWGPRTADILGASLLTLARTPGMTLAALPVLLTNQGFRRKIVARVSDPIGLGPFWATYESWSEQERMTAISPSMNKLRPLLLRPELRAVVGQSRPRFSLQQVFTERKILLCNLNKGLLGPETSALLGALIVSQLWQAILGRSAIPPERRHPVTIVVDEFADYLRLPMSFADALAMSRGLGASWHLAHQFMHQLDPAMRSAVLANAQNRIAWRLSNEDSRIMAAGSSLAPDDFQNLGAFSAYAQLVSADAVQPWCSIETLPPAEAISDPAAVRAASRDTYGVDRAEVEAQLYKLFSLRPTNSQDDLSPRRRSHGGQP